MTNQMAWDWALMLPPPQAAAAPNTPQLVLLWESPPQTVGVRQMVQLCVLWEEWGEGVLEGGG